MRRQTFASGSLLVGAVILIGMGIYFAFLRPPLLPEDPKYMGTSVEEIRRAVPGLLPWLSRVFGVLGGFMVATGLLTAYVAATGFREGSRGAVVTVTFSGVASIGWMVITNFLIESDFRWLLLTFLAPWVVSFALQILAHRRRTRTSNP